MEIDRQDRCCTFCDSGAAGDEKHVLMGFPRQTLSGRAFLACLIWRCRRACITNACTAAAPDQTAGSWRLVWGGDRMMVAGFMMACLGEVGLIGSSALRHDDTWWLLVI